MADQTIRQELEIVDRFSEPLKRYSEGAGDADKESKNLTTSSGKLSKGLDGVAKATKGFVVAWMGVKGLRLAEDLAKGAIQAEATGKAFDHLARKSGMASQSLMADMRNITRGMVDDTSLQMATLDALGRGVEHGALMTAVEYATGRAVAMGRDASEEIRKTLYALENGSEGAFRRIGINAEDAEKALEQMQKNMHDDQGGIVAGLQQAQAEMTNIRDELGERLMPLYEGWINSQATILRGINDIVTAMAGASEQSKKAFDMDPSSMERVIELHEDLEREQARLQALEQRHGRHFQHMTHELREQQRIQKEIRDLGVDIRRNQQGEWEYNGRTLEQLKERRDEVKGVLEDERQVVQVKKDQVKAEEARSKALEAQIQKNKQWEVEFNELQRWRLQGVEDYHKRQEAGRDQQAREESEYHNQQLEYYRVQYEHEAEQQRLEQDHWRMRRQAMRDYTIMNLNSAVQVGNAWMQVTNAQLSATRRRYQHEIDAINNARMSERRRGEERQKIEEKIKKAEEEQAKRQVAFASTVGAINTALTMQAQLRAATEAATGSFGGAITRLTRAGIVFAGLATYVAGIKSAQAQIPKREHGGVVIKGREYEAGERGKAELFRGSRGDSFIPPSSGSIVPNVSNSYGGSTYNVSVTVMGDGNPREIRTAVRDALYDLDRNNGIDYGRLSGMRRAMR